MEARVNAQLEPGATLPDRPKEPKEETPKKQPKEPRAPEDPKPPPAKKEKISSTPAASIDPTSMFNEGFWNNIQ